MTPNFATALDRYLTTPPEDDFTSWTEDVDEAYSPIFFSLIEEDWYMGDQENKWLWKLNQAGKSPKEAARIIERAHRRYFQK